MKIGYPISAREARHYLELEVGELPEETMDKIINFFRDNIISFDDKQADIKDFIDRKELEDKIDDIAYSASSDLEWNIRDAVRGALADAFRG